jgi:hypothetical protein
MAFDSKKKKSPALSKRLDLNSHRFILRGCGQYNFTDSIRFLIVCRIPHLSNNSLESFFCLGDPIFKDTEF